MLKPVSKITKPSITYADFENKRMHWPRVSFLLWDFMWCMNDLQKIVWLFPLPAAYVTKTCICPALPGMPARNHALRSAYLRQRWTSSGQSAHTCSPSPPFPCFSRDVGGWWSIRGTCPFSHWRLKISWSQPQPEMPRWCICRLTRLSTLHSELCRGWSYIEALDYMNIP